jgi:hypothetical protein
MRLSRFTAVNTSCSPVRVCACPERALRPTDAPHADLISQATAKIRPLDAHPSPEQLPRVRGPPPCRRRNRTPRRFCRPSPRTARSRRAHKWPYTGKSHELASQRETHCRAPRPPPLIHLLQPPPRCFLLGQGTFHSLPWPARTDYAPAAGSLTACACAKSPSPLPAPAPPPYVRGAWRPAAHPCARLALLQSRLSHHRP